MGIEDDIREIKVYMAELNTTFKYIGEKLDKILGKGFVFNKELKADKAESLGKKIVSKCCKAHIIVIEREDTCRQCEKPCEIELQDY